MQMFFYLLCGHALADYSLQTDFIAKGKNRRTPIPGVPWYYIMLSHCLIHGGTVGLLTGNIYFAVIETILHFIIDVIKCEGYTNIHQDQAAHVVCKVIYSVY